MKQQEVSPESIRNGYEKGEPDSWAVFKLGIYLLFVVVAVQIVLIFGYPRLKRIFAERHGKSSIWSGQPVPRVEVTNLENESGLEYRDYLKSESQRLDTYGWVNRQEGKVRIPLQRAMEIVLQKGGKGL